MLVFRVEHRVSKFGPFHHIGGYRLPHSVYLKPDAAQDCKHPLGGTMVCGFKSMKQMEEWFDKLTRRALRHRGNFVLQTYEVPRDAVLIGWEQLAFDRAKATPVETLELE